jgi:transcriptional regulator with XRE-family HTH domain
MSNIASTNENAEIGGRLASVREKLRLSQRDFAAKLGVSLRAYQNYERGEREITPKLIRALYEVFRIQPVWLLLGGDNPHQDRGPIDPTLAEGIAGEFGEAIKEVRSRDLLLFPSWLLLGYRLALIYNRVIKRVKPGEPFGDVVSEEVRFLRDLEIHNSVSGNPPKFHPEEVVHLESIGSSVEEVTGVNAGNLEVKRDTKKAATRSRKLIRPAEPRRRK